MPVRFAAAILRIETAVVAGASAILAGVQPVILRLGAAQCCPPLVVGVNCLERLPLYRLPKVRCHASWH